MALFENSKGRQKSEKTVADGDNVDADVNGDVRGGRPTPPGSLWRTEMRKQKGHNMETKENRVVKIQSTTASVIIKTGGCVTRVYLNITIV